MILIDRKHGHDIILFESSILFLLYCIYLCRLTVVAIAYTKQSVELQL